MVQAIFDNDLFRAYFFYSSLLVVKMLIMSTLTARQRFKTKAFANPEDAHPQRVKVKVDENVERVRRAHLNDLENILPFFVIAFIYLQTNPSTFLALNLFRAFTATRFAHTVVYTLQVPQPARAITWMVGYGITLYMGVVSASYFF